MTQSGQSSNGANNSSYAAQYGGKYAQQYLPSAFLMAQSGSSEQGSKRQGGNGNDAAQYGGKYMTQSGQSSNGANNSSYAAQYGGKYAQQYLPSVFLMAQSGSSEQGSKKKVLDGVDYRAKYSEKYGGSYASKYGKSSQVAKNSTAKQGSYYQTMYG